MRRGSPPPAIASIGSTARSASGVSTVYQPYNGMIVLGEYHDLYSWYDAVNNRMIWLSADTAIPWPWTQGDIGENQIQP